MNWKNNNNSLEVFGKILPIVGSEALGIGNFYIRLLALEEG